MQLCVSLFVLCVSVCLIVCLCASQAEACVCPASARAMTAGVETAADAPPPPPAAYQPTAPSAVGGAAASAAGACATTRSSTESGARNVPPARAAVNQTGTSYRLHPHSAVDVVVAVNNSSCSSLSLFILFLLPQELRGLPRVSWPRPPTGRTLQQNLPTLSLVLRQAGR